MTGRPRACELEAVRFKGTRLSIGLAAGAVAVLLGITALAATAGTTTRHAPLYQLQRTATPGPVPSGSDFHVVRRAVGGHSVIVVVTPNRPSGPNGLSVRLAEGSQPLSRARVTVAFSMPSMMMWNAYAVTLAPTGLGRYAATVPVIGMAGRWQLRLDVAPRTGRAFRVTVNDRMHR
jgi:YtkA-like